MNGLRKIPPKLADDIEDWMQEQCFERRRFAQCVARSVKQARRAKGMTQFQLAAKIGSTQASISRLESGRLTDVGIQMLQRIGSALGREARIGFGPRSP